MWLDFQGTLLEGTSLSRSLNVNGLWQKTFLRSSCVRAFTIDTMLNFACNCEEPGVWFWISFSWKYKGLFTTSESSSESEKDQRTSKKDQRINGKHQRKFSLSLGLNTVYVCCCDDLCVSLVDYYNRRALRKNNCWRQTSFHFISMLMYILSSKWSFII